MCGIVGVLNQHGMPVSRTLLQKMIQIMHHRGPDAEGIYNEGALGFGHCRLTILDPSSNANQPMVTSDKRFVMIYNGEIYNFSVLRAELEALGTRFYTRGDTEVALNAFAVWGVAAFEKFNGMFAFAVWDRHKKTVYLCRDRYGVKPLYWYYKNNELIFASEIKAILMHPSVQRDISYSALSEYFTFQNVFSDLTLFKDIKLLSPGCYLTIELTRENKPQKYRYWDYSFRTNFSLKAEESIEQLNYLFTQAVNRQMVADTSVGAYLSGGLDSGSITAIASKNVSRLSTFTCGFDLSSASGLELGFDERQIAELMANAFKTEHYEVVLHAGDMEYILPTLIWHLEDLRVGQCYPNYYVSRLASKFVKVVLSGAGGDELFAGYPWRYLTNGFNGFDDFSLKYYLSWQRLVADSDKPLFFNREVYGKLQHVDTFEIFNAQLNCQQPVQSLDDFLNLNLLFELKTFLPGLLLVEDKLSMANSLETRVPFLDNDLVDFALKLPVNLKTNLHQIAKLVENSPNEQLHKENSKQQGKKILRSSMEKLLPKEVLARRKQGFSAPDASWFRGESIDYINKLLRSKKASIYEFVSPIYVNRILDEHCSGKRNHRLLIWSLLSFEWWCRIYLFSDSFSNLSIPITPQAAKTNEYTKGIYG